MGAERNKGDRVEGSDGAHTTSTLLFSPCRCGSSPLVPVTGVVEYLNISQLSTCKITQLTSP